MPRLGAQERGFLRKMVTVPGNFAADDINLESNLLDNS